MYDYDVTQYTCHDGGFAKILIPNNVTEDDLRGLYELLQVVAVRRFGLDLTDDEGYERGKADEHRWWSEHCANCTDADRPQGEWLKFGLGRGTRILFCTNCERKIEVPLSQGDSNYDFCPNCSAKMKGTE